MQEQELGGSLYLQLEDLVIDGLENSPIKLAFQPDYLQLREEHAIKLFDRQTPVTAELHTTLCGPLQQSLFKYLFHYVLLRKFPFVRGKDGPQLEQLDQLIKATYSRIFMGAKRHKSEVSNAVVFIQGFLVFRRMFNLFRSQRHLFDQRLKYDILHFANFLVFGLHVGDYFVRKVLDSLLRQVDLVYKKERTALARIRAEQQQARRLKNQCFINSHIKLPPKNTNLPELTERRVEPTEDTLSSPPLVYIQAKTSCRKFELTQTSSSIGRFLHYSQPKLMFRSKQEVPHCHQITVQPILAQRKFYRCDEPKPPAAQQNVLIHKRSSITFWKNELGKMKGQYQFAPLPKQTLVMPTLDQQEQKHEITEMTDLLEKKTYPRRLINYIEEMQSRLIESEQQPEPEVFKVQADSASRSGLLLKNNQDSPNLVRLYIQSKSPDRKKLNLAIRTKTLKKMSGALQATVLKRNYKH